MGHGWVTPRPDGAKARCGGPAICRECALEAGRFEAERAQAERPVISTHPPLTPPARYPHRCPVCEGRGRVDRDFYGETMNASVSIICQSCHGTGVLWS